MTSCKNDKNVTRKLLAGVGRMDGKRGYIDVTGKIVIPFDYEVARSFHCGRAEVCQNGKRGFIDESGNLVIPCIYGRVWDFDSCNGYAKVCKNGKYGYIDRDGTEILKCNYHNVGEISDEGIVKVSDDGVNHYVDLSGKVIFSSIGQRKLIKEDLDYYEIVMEGAQIECEGDFHEGMATISLTNGSIFNSKYGYIDSLGNIVVPCIFLKAGRFNDGIARVKMGSDVSVAGDNQRMSPGKYGYIDKTGKIVIPLCYDELEDFYEDLAAAAIKGKWGFINRAGEVVIPFEYDGAKFFSEGLAAVKREKKWGFIDKYGKEVIPFEYDDFSYKKERFSKGVVIVKKGNEYGVIDKNGAEIIPFIYKYVTDGGEGFFSIIENDKYGFIDRDRNVICPCRYDYVSEFHNGFAKVSIKTGSGLFDSIEGYINTKGEEVIPCQYHVAGDFNYTDE